MKDKNAFLIAAILCASGVITYGLLNQPVSPTIAVQSAALPAASSYELPRITQAAQIAPREIQPSAGTNNSYAVPSAGIAATNDIYSYEHKYNELKSEMNLREYQWNQFYEDVNRYMKKHGLKPFARRGKPTGDAMNTGLYGEGRPKEGGYGQSRPNQFGTIQVNNPK